MSTGLTECEVLQAAFNLWDDMAKHGYEYRYESEYYEEASYKGRCILCAYYGLKCEDCALGKDFGGKYSNCTIYPNHPYYRWFFAKSTGERSRRAGTIATRIKKRLEEVINDY